MSKTAIFSTYNDLCLEIELLKEQITLTEYELEYWLGIKLNDRYLDGIPLGSYGAFRFGVKPALEQAETVISNLNRLNEHREKLEQAKQQMETISSKFDKLEYKVAYKRFVEGKTLKEIAGELEYSYDYIREVMSRMKKRMRNPQSSHRHIENKGLI